MFHCLALAITAVDEISPPELSHLIRVIYLLQAEEELQQSSMSSPAQVIVAERRPSSFLLSVRLSPPP